MNKSKNINWINAVKAISIIAVFLVHCQSYYGYEMKTFDDFIHPFYVNAFFFISGFLLFRKQLSTPLIEEKSSEYAISGG